MAKIFGKRWLFGQVDKGHEVRMALSTDLCVPQPLLSENFEEGCVYAVVFWKP